MSFVTNRDISDFGVYFIFWIDSSSKPQIFIRYCWLSMSRTILGMWSVWRCVSVFWLYLIHYFPYFFDRGGIPDVSGLDLSLSFQRGVYPVRWFFEGLERFSGVWDGRPSEIFAFECRWLWMVTFWLSEFGHSRCLTHWLECWTWLDDWKVVGLLCFRVDIWVFKSFVVWRYCTICCWWPLPHILRVQSVARISSADLCWAEAALVGLGPNRWITGEFSVGDHFVLGIDAVFWAELVLVCRPVCAWVIRTHILGCVWYHRVLRVAWNLVVALSKEILPRRIDSQVGLCISQRKF